MAKGNYIIKFNGKDIAYGRTPKEALNNARKKGYNPSYDLGFRLVIPDFRI